MEIRENIGELDTLVTVKECLQSIGSQGQKTTSFRDFRRVWAKVEKTESESVDNSNYKQGFNLLLTMYKIPEMTTKWAIEVSGKLYMIGSIDSINRFSPLCQVTAYAIDG